MAEHPDDCPFCRLPASGFMIENDLAYAMYDANPISPYHSLIIPRRHTEDYFELSGEEVQACHELMQQMQQLILAKGKGISGFNIGVNNGKSAGQSILHSHIHLIPRRPADVHQPEGGVRNVIPGQGQY